MHNMQKICKKFAYCLHIFLHGPDADPMIGTAFRESGLSREAFAQSLLDGKRLAITADELVDTVFYFRFKRSAGSYWTDKDPFWTANQPMRISFGRDGSVSGFPWDVLQMRWHFVDQAGHPCEGSGEYMRVAVNGRCVPTYKISRHSNWGFIMQVRSAQQT